MKLTKIAAATALSALALSPLLGHAESNFGTGATAGTTATPLTARLDFSITIPRVIYLQVSTGTISAVNTTIDLLSFAPAAASVGNGTAVVGTGGDQAAGAVTIRTYGNNGNITLNSTTTGPLTNGVATQTIPWSAITVAAGALAATTAGYTNAAITHPAFNLAAAGGAVTATTLTATNNVVRQEGKWTYSYANTAFPAAGTYGGAGTLAAGVNNGRVSYTVAMP